MASSVIQLELEEGEIDDDDENMGKSRWARAARRLLANDGTENASTANAKMVALKVPTFDSSPDEVAIQLHKDEVNNDQGEGDDDDDDDCVVTYEKPAVIQPVSSKPLVRRHVPHEMKRVQTTHASPPPSLLTISCKAPTMLTNKKRVVANRSAVQSNKKALELPNYRPRVRLREQPPTRKIRGAPPPTQMPTSSRGFYRSKYSASQPWRSRTRLSMPGRARTPSKGVRHKTRSMAREKPSTLPSSRSSVDPSYEDLLAQYRRIQSQLEDLGKEDEDEENMTDMPFTEIDEDQNNSSVTPATIADVNKENLISDNEYIELRAADVKKNDKSTGWDKLAPRRRVSSRSSSGHKNISHKAKAQNKDEDDDELELRRIALASAFHRKPGKGLSENIERLSVSLEKNHEKFNVEVVPPESVASSATVVISKESKERKLRTGGGGDDDDDEDILRAMLLSSISNKQLEKNTRRGNTPALQPAMFGVDETSLDSVSQKKPTTAPTKTQSSVFVAPPLPKHDPVVISLKDDTDSEPEDRSMSKDVSLFSTIDSFLTEVRQQVDQSKQEKQVDVPRTPSAVLSLPSPDLEEYRRLKAEIEKRERFMSRGAPRQLSTETITVTVPQHSDKQKTIVVHHSYAETSNASIQARLKDCELKLQRHSQEMLDSQRELQRFKLHVNAKEAVIKAADLKISKLKELLAAAERVAVAQRANFETVKRRHDDLSIHIESMKTEKQKLQSQCLAYGKRLYGESFQVPQSFRILGVKRKSISLSNTAQSGKKKKPEPQRKVLQPSSAKRLKVNNNEMIRLKAMEQEIALKLQELRRKANNTLAVNTENNNVVTSAGQPPSNVQRRRRSFLEKNQSTKPQIYQGTTGSTVIAAMSRDTDQLTEVTAASASTICFTDAQLQAAKRLKSESVNNISFNRINGETLNPYEMHIVLHCRTENVTGLKIVENRNFTEVVKLGEPISAIGPYTSVLLHCRTYRFSPYFRNKANQCLTWPTHMHKLSPRRILCRFELTGTCNDDECSGQHIRDYTMTAKEALCDIVSFCPRLANVSDGATVEECKLKIEAYVEKLQSSNLDRMTHDQLCILTVGRVNEALGKAPPHYITFEERRWRPSIESDDAFDVEYEPIANRKKNIFSRGSHCEDIIPDEVVGEGDARYFSTSAEAADALEFAVLKSPTDANLWLRLAYKKLDGRGRSADVSLDMALNVLSRGLEENLHNKDLWLHYLSLYSRRKEREDLLSLCEQAVGFCPCYKVWWKYLQEIRNFTSKRETCKSVLNFVLKSDVDLDIKSHQILEVLLYDVQLNVLSGRLNDGKKILELCVLEQKATNETDLFRSLVDVHKCVLWLCYIHMVEFHCLPNSLFDPANSGPGRIVCMTPFLLPWRQGCDFRTSVSHVRKLFMVALRKCVRKGQSATANAEVCLPLYRNLMAFEICRNKHQLAVNICRQLLETAPTQEVFIVLAGMFYGQKDFTAVRQTFNEAIKVSSSSPLIHYFAASYELSAGNAQDACGCVSRYLATVFDLSDQSQPEEEVDRVEEMYSQLLGRTVAPTSTVYALRISKSDVNKGKPYLWLSYCIWLESLGRHTDVVEAYEAAILQMLSMVDLQIVWLRYLQYALQRIAVSSSSTTECDFGRYTSLVHRCLTSVLCLAPFPEAERGRSCSDYSFFNKVVDSYMNVLHESQRIGAYQSFCSLSPENTVLALRLLQLYLDAGQYREAWSLVKSQLEHSPHCWDLWKVAIYLAKRTKRLSVVRLLFEDAVNALPFNIQVWRQFIVSELAGDRTENAERLLNRCRQSGIAVDDILKD